MGKWTARDIPDQTGRRAIVTGANGGLGYQVCLELARRGASVVLAARSAEKGEEALRRLRAEVPSAQAELRSLDLADLASVRAFADGVDEPVDLLVNNAGVMAGPKRTTADGFELQLGTNHLGHFALTGLLLGRLLASEAPRVVVVSSNAHKMGKMRFDDLQFERRPYGRWQAYFQSKLANLLFTAELQRRLTVAGAPTIAVAAHPGGSSTDLGTEGSGLTNRLMRAVVEPLTQSVAVGALPMLRALTAGGVRGGEFQGPRYLAVGHPRRETPSRAARREQDARRLWDVSAALSGLQAPLPV